MNKIKQWHSGLAKREQNLVNVASIVLAIGLIFQLLIGPVNDRAAKAQRDLDNKQKLLTWVAENSAKYRAASSSGGKSRGSLSNIANRTARQAGISISGTKPQGSELQIQLDSVPFNNLMKWLEKLVNQEHVKITMVDISASDNPGEVKVRRLQLAQ
ncbi:type II secretion system protein M [Saccharobesus litoralis]|uniref:Type II secretion system protein M n=1 Tax=Saccharobesus litoralis TaxID=2172099 RepID=A0A2S0VWX5_9ALTE|nr:type II secretion system protein M [Saccharobesus litoralis]AWB68683.1 type II secretion system protein M [Saccharobesus litoralis]